jgi:hypothetical protein
VLKKRSAGKIIRDFTVWREIERNGEIIGLNLHEDID